ncbi:hypothetical protein CYY_004219 [Polysphondylium violaceum]|uniref:FAM50A/XAP5 C-terminal domain-containing protein n=1 Tax=Polysphondylium violaceum TaxID=133409 RepID=A0A8J4V7Z0_9MYCE|nr:hypothetical protein CYY_004219 [Polysphondylium violaceum]
MAEYKGNNADGAKIRMLEKQRENEIKEREKRKEKLKEDLKKASVISINDKFQSVEDANATSTQFKSVGLVSVNDLKNNIKTQTAIDLEKKKRPLNQDSAKNKKPKVIKSTLSFNLDDEEEEEQNDNNKLKGDDNSNNTEKQQEKKSKFFGKDPTVNTEFLPDVEREELEKLERERLTKEWNDEQERIKSEVIEITYSYWDGSGHRRSLTCTKGTTIEKFLDQARKEFKELRGVGVDHLLFIKEDIIIPQTYSFYDLIISKARGKSGPLFKFDVHEDIRLVSDATVEKDESHAAKMVEKGWYERNKHIFPASRWEVYDPTINRDKYTISDKLSNK